MRINNLEGIFICAVRPVRHFMGNPEIIAHAYLQIKSVNLSYKFILYEGRAK